MREHGWIKLSTKVHAGGLLDMPNIGRIERLGRVNISALCHLRHLACELAELLIRRITELAGLLLHPHASIGIDAVNLGQGVLIAV
jgi:hypothetical protein